MWIPPAAARAQITHQILIEFVVDPFLCGDRDEMPD